MKKIAMIPARYAATRFPGKLMQSLGGQTVISRTFLATVETGLFDDVIVVTDSDVIRNEIKRGGGSVIISKSLHESGTDRIAEAARDLDVDVIVNVQGDSPFVKREPMANLLKQFEDPSVMVASLMHALEHSALIADPNHVKVCVDKKMQALFFSRSVIPYPRNKHSPIVHYKHIGVYAFRKQALLDFTGWPVSPLEDAEKIECLRYLENGVPIRMVLTEHVSIEIDTPEQLVQAAELLENNLP